VRINWINHRFYPHDGYGRYGVNMVRALIRLGVDVRPYVDTVLDMPADLQRLMGLDFTRLTFSLMPPHNMRDMVGRHWGYTMTEAWGMPDGWVDHLNNKCERVLVPRPWLVTMMREQGVNRPLHVIRGGVDPVEFPIIYDRPADRPFTFLCIGPDRGERKGYDLVWRAFYEAFADTEAHLIIKTRAQNKMPIDNTRSRDDTAKRVSLFAADVPSMADVYGLADCFVFPSRGEGEGMPPREAAAMGIPVIATAWSGLAEHIDRFAIPLREFKRVPAPTISDCITGEWVDPDLDELIAQMRWVYDHYSEAKANALKAARWLRDNETWAHSAQHLLELLEAYA